MVKYINQDACSQYYNFHSVIDNIAKIVAEQTDWSDQDIKTLIDDFHEDSQGKIWNPYEEPDEVRFQVKDKEGNEHTEISYRYKVHDFQEIIERAVGKTTNDYKAFCDFIKNLASREHSGEWVNGKRRPVEWINPSIPTIPHNPNEKTFLYAFSKLFCTADSAHILQNLTSVRRFCENIHYSFGTPGAEYDMMVTYFFSQTKGNLKSSVAKTFCKAIESYGAPTIYSDIDERHWRGEEYSKNALVYVDEVKRSKSFTSQDFNNWVKDMTQERRKGFDFPTYKCEVKGKQAENLKLIANILMSSNIQPPDDTGRRLASVFFGDEFGFRNDDPDYKFSNYTDYTKEVDGLEAVKWCKMLIESCPFGKIWKEKRGGEINANALITICREIDNLNDDRTNQRLKSCSIQGLFREYDDCVKINNARRLTDQEREQITEQVMVLWKERKINTTLKTGVVKYRKFDFSEIHKMPYSDEVAGDITLYDVSEDEINAVIKEKGYDNKPGTIIVWRAFIRNELTCIKLGATAPEEPTPDPDKPTKPEDESTEKTEPETASVERIGFGRKPATEKSSATEVPAKAEATAEETSEVEEEPHCEPTRPAEESVSTPEVKDNAEPTDGKDDAYYEPFEKITILCEDYNVDAKDIGLYLKNCMGVKTKAEAIAKLDFVISNFAKIAKSIKAGVLDAPAEKPKTQREFSWKSQEWREVPTPKQGGEIKVELTEQEKEQRRATEKNVREVFADYIIEPVHEVHTDKTGKPVVELWIPGVLKETEDEDEKVDESTQADEHSQAMQAEDIEYDEDGFRKMSNEEFFGSDDYEEGLF